MRILFISGLLSCGGASKLIYDLLPRMKEKGHDCELLILKDNQSKYIEDLEGIGISVNIVPNTERGHVKKILYLKKWIENGHYDVIHVNLFPTIYYCSIVKRLLGKKCPPMVMTEHNTDNRRRHKPYLRALEKNIYKGYDHVISISNKTQENLSKWLDTEGNTRFSVIENGIDIEAFRDAESLDKNEICPNYEEGDILLLTVGRFERQKNHDKLVDALAELPCNYKLILCGEGTLEYQIREKVKKCGLTERVVFLGFRKDIARIMHTADILVISSLWEGFGLIAAEGMACGIPIAASDVPGLSEVVGDAGVKFDPYDPNDMVCKIESISAKVKHILIHEGQEKAMNYSIDRMVSNYLEVYTSVYMKNN